MRENNAPEPEIVVECVPLLNGGPAAVNEEPRTTIVNRITTTNMTTSTTTAPMELVSLLLLQSVLPV